MNRYTPCLSPVNSLFSLLLIHICHCSSSYLVLCDSLNLNDDLISWQMYTITRLSNGLV